MKCIKADLPKDIKQLELHTLADLHIGDKHCDMQKIGEMIRAIRDNDNAYCILNGDILNNNTKTSIGDIYSEQLTPMQQIQEAVNLLYPIKDKIIGMTAGNHSLRTYRKEGVDLMAIMAREMGLYDVYGCEGILLFVSFGEQQGRTREAEKGKPRKMCYAVYATHGSGGGRKEGAKAIRLADMASIVDADIYIHSHTHLPMIMKQGFMRLDRQHGTASQVDKLFVNTAATLDYGSYGQMYEFKPASKESPIIYMDGTRRKFHATL